MNFRFPAYYINSSIKKIFSIVVLFAFFYPETYVFFPLSTTTIVQIFGLLYSLLYFFKYRIPKVYLSVIILGLIIFSVGFISAKIINHDGDLDVAKRGVLMISYVFTGFWIIKLIASSVQEYSIYTVIRYLILITLIQAIISFIFFIFPNISESYRSIISINPNTQNFMEKLSTYRLIGIGDVKYATGAVQYGLVMWGIITLSCIRRGKTYFSFPQSIALVTVFTLAGIMSGRVFFVILLCTPIYIAYLENNIIKGIIVFTKLYTPVLVFLLIAFIYLLSKYSDLIAWAFELFINYGSGGSLESESTNQLKDMYIYPTNLKTWLFGDGRSISDTGFFYMNSDVGYIRSIFYWGIIGTLIYYGIQYKLYLIFKKISNHIIMNKYYLFIIIWLYIYSLKDFYSAEKFLILFIIAQKIKI